MWKLIVMPFDLLNWFSDFYCLLISLITARNQHVLSAFLSLFFLGENMQIARPVNLSRSGENLWSAL